MNREQALAEAQRRFGLTVRLRRETRGVHRLYRIGRGNGWPEVVEIGRGQSWEDALADADRRQGGVA